MGDNWNQDRFYDIKQTSDNGFILAGFSNSYNFTQGGGVPYLVKVDSNGNKQWSKGLAAMKDNNGGDDISNIVINSNGGYTMSGLDNSWNISGADREFLLLKTDSMGRTVDSCFEVTMLDTCINLHFYEADISIDSIIVTDSIQEGIPDFVEFDFMILDSTVCPQPVGIIEKQNATTNDWVVKIYPNPFSQQTLIIINNSKYPVNSKLEMRVYNVLGREVFQNKLSSNEYTFERENLISGIYFYKIINQERQIVGTGKLIVE